MKKRIIAVIFISLCASFSLFGQESEQDKKRARVIITNSSDNGVTAIPSPTPRKVVVITGASPQTDDETTITPSMPLPATTGSIDLAQLQIRSLRMGEIQRSLNEAKRQMRVKPLRISMSDPEQTTEIVRVAFFDWDTNEVDYAVIMKSAFLDSNSDAMTRSENGKWVRIRTIRGNGVNTPIMVIDGNNKPHLPLVVQYPIEKYGKFVEMAYYVSTHPGMVTPETVNAGKIYVRNTLNAARAKLREQGIFIQPKVVDIAERLALVEHVDHWRFKNEFPARVFDDVYMLYAMNQGGTYRYSVSSAGAGGMVQMIPSTYRMIRSRYYSVGLMPDFVEGMRNHLNASKAMLLYMQMTWNDLVSNSTVYSAMESGIATQEQLMAAGYNSNPSRLSKYISRGGSNWTALIPRETKMYLQIYEKVEEHVSFVKRTN